MHGIQKSNQCPDVSQTHLLRLCGDWSRCLGFGSRRLCWSCSRDAADYRRMLDHIQLRILAVEIGLSEFRNLVLLLRWLFAILIVEHLNNFHARRINCGERGKTFAVEKGIVSEVDEDLCGTGIGLWRLCKSHKSAFIALRYGVILNIAIPPRRRHRGIRANAEMYHEARVDAVHHHVVEKMMLNEIVEAVHANRRP